MRIALTITPDDELMKAELKRIDGLTDVGLSDFFSRAKRTAETSARAGEWSGEYSSGESGRSGSITFTLRSAGDSAFGDVVMIPSGLGRPVKPYNEGQIAEPSSASPTTVLTIRFVRVEQGRVSGTLDPYADPQTGERLFTTFVGDLKGNAIEGTYTTRLQSGVTQTGRWSVLRRT